MLKIKKCLNQFDYELEYLIWLFLKKREETPITKRPQIQRYSLYLKHLSELKYQIEIDSTEQKGELVSNLVERINSEFLLDYIIWQYLRYKKHFFDIEEDDMLTNSEIDE